MKLFIWVNPYSVWYGSSLLFAVAETVEEAKKIAATSPKYEWGEFLKAAEFGKHIELGEPTRIVEIPSAEWHEWKE